MPALILLNKVLSLFGARMDNLFLIAVLLPILRYYAISFFFASTRSWLRSLMKMPSRTSASVLIISFFRVRSIGPFIAVSNESIALALKA